jgi:Raf kinase inhibitor-like YbhB/YbcL family protein
MTTLTSSAFKNGERVPVTYTGDGVDKSPPLAWTDAPSDTKAFVLICDDPDAPVGNWVHWVLYDILASTNALPECVPPKENVLTSAKQGRNDFRKIGYGGPAPPPGKPHRYIFTLYAVDRETGLAPGATREQVLKAIKGHVLATAKLMGLYSR